jgi:hypothetical protein
VNARNHNKHIEVISTMSHSISLPTDWHGRYRSKNKQFTRSIQISHSQDSCDCIWVQIFIKLNGDRVKSCAK